MGSGVPPRWPSGVAGCVKCGGTGVWNYDHNHGSPCPDCCTHPGGWWVLAPEFYNASDDRYAACRSPGCGTTISRAEYESHAPAGALPEALLGKEHNDE